MSVFFDIQATQHPAHGERGIPRYVGELAVALERFHPGRVSRYLLNPNFAVPQVVDPLAARRKLAWVDRIDGSIGRVYHVGSPVEGPTLQWIWPHPARRMRLAVTLYDVIPDVFAEAYLADPAHNRSYRRHLELVRRADAVLAISNATATDAVERLGIHPEKVSVVGTGVSRRFRRPKAWKAAFDAARATLPWLKPGYILYVGGNDYRKNLEGLLTAYAALPESVQAKHSLVIVYRILANEDALTRRVNELRIGDRVRFTGFVSDDDLVSLYQAAELFVFPSLYEGFGLPVAEAIASGVPAIAGRNSSLVELIEDDEALFDSQDPRSIKDAIERCLTNDALLRRLRAKTLPQRHTWKGVAERTVACYDALERLPRRRGRGRKRIAYVSPLPPVDTSAARFSHSLLEELVSRCDVDAFVDDLSTSAYAPEGVRVQQSRSFDIADRARGGYDGLIYCLANSNDHAFALALLRQRPGVVLAKDVRLAGIGESLDREAAGLDGDVLSSGRDGLTREAIGLSQRFLVSSNYAAQLAALAAAPGDEAKIELFPFAVRAVAHTDARPRHRPVIVSFAGNAADDEKVLRAFAKIVARSDALLAILGITSVVEQTRIAQAADALGVADRLRAPTELTVERRQAWLGHATMAVDVREPWDGDTQDDVGECLGASLPTIVAGAAASTEWPDQTVVRVDRYEPAEQLGDEMLTLLLDAERQASLARAAHAFAREHTFAALADFVLERSP